MANGNAQDVTLTSIHLLTEGTGSDQDYAWLQASQDGKPEMTIHNGDDDDDDWTGTKEWALPFEPISPSLLSDALAVDPTTSPRATCSSFPWIGKTGSKYPKRVGTTKAKKSSKTNGASKTASPPTPSLSWADVLYQYQELMANKGQWDSRRFNKTVHALLDSCITLAQNGQGGVSNAPTTMGSGTHASPNTSQLQTSHPDNLGLDWSQEQEALSSFRELLLNSKEIVSEQLIERVINYIQQGLPPLLTADEKKDMLLKRSLAFVSELSPQLSIKISPVIRSYVARLFDSQLDNLFAEIRMPEMPLKEKSCMYRRMLSNFIDNPSCVSFAATNKQLLGRISPVDMWFLTFFACVMTRRMRGDNLLQLGCVGKSSVGKSLLFESILLVTAHQLLSTATSGSSDGGCGRFSVGSKNTIVFHDINIATLTGVDLERVKSLARTENTVAKVHSSTTTVSPMFVFYTSNERLFRHVIPPSISGTGLSCSYSSQADGAPGKKRVSEENLEAVRARFLELFVFKIPPQDQRDLDTCGTFSREHFILGTYDRALDILEKYDPLDFHSAYLPAYVTSALLKNVDFMEEVMCQATPEDKNPSRECPRHHRQRAERLREKFNVCCL